MGVVSFDFDGTLCCVDQHNNSLMRPNPRALKLFEKHKKAEDKIYIVTYRNPDHETKEYKDAHPERVLISDFLRTHELEVDGIIFTNHEPKLEYLININSKLHYDDCFKVLQELENINIECVYISPIIIIT